MTKTIRVSDEAHAILMEVLGIMTFKKRCKIYIPEVIDRVVKLIPDEWRKLNV